MEPTATSPAFLAPRPKGSATALAELLAAFRGGARKAQVRGVSGAARGYVLAQLARDSKRPLVCVEPDEEAAEALEKDLRFFAGNPAVVRIPADEVLPYEGLTPDRFVAQQRLAALFRLHLGERPIVVCSVRSVGRRVLPRAALDRRSLQIELEMEQDRDELARKLTAAGYAKVPLVEDPGTYAIRGGVFDVWSPLETQPARLEFFGDLVEKIRTFDPQTQRTISEVKEISLCPAREIVLDEEGRRAAIATVRAAADAVETPSRQLRELIDDLSTLSQDDELFAAGLSAILPGFYPGGLSPLTEYLPRDAIWVLDDPMELERQWGDLWSALEDAFEAARGKGELALPPDRHFLHERDLRPVVESSPLLVLSGLTLGAEPAVGTAEIDFELQPTSDLRAEIQSHHGEDGALTPLVRRLESLRERGTTAVIACHSSAQAEQTRRLLLDRNLMAQIVPLAQAAYSPSVHAHLVVGEISAGFLDANEHLAVFSDEDVFGPRAQARRAARKPRGFGAEAADFRDLKEGDLVVHVDHGIARYDGLTSLNVRGFAADFIVLQFAGKDKLYLPVGRLRQIQKYAGGDPEKVRLDSLKSQTFAKRKARVKEQLLKMAAELLDIYAARAAHPGYRLPRARRDVPRVRGRLPVRGDARPGARHRRGARATCRRSGRWTAWSAATSATGRPRWRMRAAMLAVLGQEAGGGAGADHRARLAARAHLPRALRRATRSASRSVSRMQRRRSRSAAILKELATGKVDVVIGTHRLLSPDVSLQGPGAARHRRGAALRRRAQGAAEEAAQARRRADADRDADPAHAAHEHGRRARPLDHRHAAGGPARHPHLRLEVRRRRRSRRPSSSELARGGQVFFVHNRVRIHRGHGQVPDGARAEGAHRGGPRADGGREARGR